VVSRACRYAIRMAAAAWLLAIVLFLLSACGGGDADEDEHKTIQPPNCISNPEQCK
jgi:hypothetical protein